MPALVLRPIVPALAVLALALPASSSAAAPQLTGPSHARVGARVSFLATGEPAGSYTLRLVYVLSPDHIVVGTSCTAKIAAASADAAGRVEVKGRLPGRLACRSGAGPVEGHYDTRPGGHYLITLSRNQPGMPFGAEPFLKRSFRITR
jgi:hypothetical protein